MQMILQPVGGVALTIGDGTPWKITKPIQGLESAPERNTIGDYSGADGGFIGSQFYSVRNLTIPGAIISSSAVQHAIDRQSLFNALPINTDIAVTIIMPNGQSYYLLARRTGLVAEQQAPSYSPFKFDIVSESPYIFDNNSLSVTVAKKAGGGFVLPVVLPIVFAAGSGPTAINNTGAVKIYPTITVNGSAQNPKISNLTSGEFVKINVTTASGDVLVIDMQQRTVKLNGSNILAYRDSTSSWWGLAAGNNNIEFTTDSGADTGSAVVAYRPAYVGV